MICCHGWRKEKSTPGKTTEMDTFGFTQKKWQTLTALAHHRHLIQWLSQFYHKLTTNRVSPETWDLFSRQYSQALSWSGFPPFIAPREQTPRHWLEAVSDRIHYHRAEAGIEVKDTDLLTHVETRDEPEAVTGTNIDCHIALDGLRSLYNVGAVFRICDAAGFNSVILGNTKGKEDTRVQKTSMGAAQWIEQEKTQDLYSTLMRKKKDGYTIIGVETIKGAVPYDKAAWQPKTIILFGNEEYGIASHNLGICDQFVSIPMFGRKNSINVAACAAVICLHVAGSLNTSL